MIFVEALDITFFQKEGLAEKRGEDTDHDGWEVCSRAPHRRVVCSLQVSKQQKVKIRNGQTTKGEVRERTVIMMDKKTK